jgi:hypothetical protein
LAVHQDFLERASDLIKFEHELPQITIHPMPAGPGPKDDKGPKDHGRRAAFQTAIAAAARREILERVAFLSDSFLKQEFSDEGVRSRPSRIYSD